ncbi:MAG: polymer-forming cytoskeletal protein [Kiloniellales bacterium]|nr:polymer-forming cytoskeletal protein [Kiloniellales bacterium]
MFSSKIDKPNADGNGKASEADPKLGASKETERRRETSLDRVVVRGFFQLNEEGELQIGGDVEGDIECHALTILESGSMEGNVLAERLLIEGAYDGNVETTRLTVASSAKLVSDDVLVHDQVVIEPKAHFEGVLRRPGQAGAGSVRKPDAKAAGSPAEGNTRAAAARKNQSPSKRGLPDG